MTESAAHPFSKGFPETFFAELKNRPFTTLRTSLETRHGTSGDGAASTTKFFLALLTGRRARRGLASFCSETPRLPHFGGLVPMHRIRVFRGTTSSRAASGLFVVSVFLRTRRQV
jgi:hypothetical protein